MKCLKQRMNKGAIVHVVWGISFEGSWKFQTGDTIFVNGEERVIVHKADSVVYVEPFSGTDVFVKDV